MICISIIISIIYAILIIAFIVGYDNVELIENKNTTAKNTFSIIIPFRNEAHNLPKLLDSISRLKYPTSLYELILVNDDSQDNFTQIIEDSKKLNPALNLHLIKTIRKTNSPKKDAINTAINCSNFEWIVTTDADCEVPIAWLRLFNQCIEDENPVFISGPVKFSSEKSLIFHFQNLNFISLIGSTIGGFGIKKTFMCNGANLCYHKDTFVKLQGFEGNTTIASGDDVFLLEKMHYNFPNKIEYLKSEESIVQTNCENNWNLFLNQQIRWASKATSYKNNFAKFVGLTVFFTNLMLLVLGILATLHPIYLNIFLYILIQKMVIDFLLIFKTSIFLKNSKSLKYYPIISLLYPFFIVFIGSLSLFKNYNWKGRTFKK